MIWEFLTGTPLFYDIVPEDIEDLLSCLNAKQESFPKDNIIYHTGDTIRALGVILSGSVSIEHIDFWGNRILLDQAGSGQVFAETYACLQETPLMVDVLAAEDCKILFLELDRLLLFCHNACGCHNLLIRNLLTISAQKNLALSRRSLHTAPKSIRERLLSYLSFQAVQQNRNDFDIPFNRQQLADYLNVDRSALSHELSKMQREGLLAVHKNHFCLKSMTHTTS